jgi:beta-lactamase regulating signal transducer with metallopeptidase domain
MHITAILSSTLPDAAGAAVADLVADALTRGTLWFALAYMVCRGVRQLSAADRHGVWVLALMATAITSLAAAATRFPGGSVLGAPMLTDASPTPEINLVTLEPPSLRTAIPPLTQLSHISESATPLESRHRRAASWLLPLDATGTHWIAALWAAGFMALLGRAVIGHAALVRLRKSATPIHDSDWLALLNHLKQARGLRRPIGIRRGPLVRLPLVLGTWSPVILLPESSRDWDGERRRAVILHELGHVRRFDCLVQDLGSLAIALLWFHPLAWFAHARLRVEREHACDDAVIGDGFKPSDYAEHLVDLAGPSGSQVPHAAVAMARTGHLTERVHAILDPLRPRHSRLPRGTLAVFAGIVGTACLFPRILAVEATNTIGLGEGTATQATNPIAALAEPLLVLTEWDDGIRRLRAAVEEQQKRVGELERNLERTRVSLQFPTPLDPRSENSDPQSNARHIEHLQAEVRSRLVRLVAQHDRIAALPEGNLTAVLLSLQPEDRLLQHLAIAQLDARLQYEASAAVHGEAHPEARRTSKVLELIDRELAGRVQGILRAMKTQIEATQAELAHLDKARQSELERASELHVYFAEKRDVENARLMLDVLSRKLAQELFDAQIPRQTRGSNTPPKP